MNTFQEVLNACYVDSSNPNLVMLPEGKLDRKVYEAVAKKLECIGGKWTRKAGGFLFPHNPTDLLDQVKGGEEINLKKQYQFFPTPPDIADYLVELADIDNTDRVLEPSAGHGAIIDAIRRVAPTCQITAVELMPECCAVLNTRKDVFVEVIQADFLDYRANMLAIAKDTARYDAIIANPPFSKNQDIAHVYAMYDLLKKRGSRLVSVMSTHWERCLGKKEADFRRFLEEVGAEIHDLPAGTFKESGTNVPAKIIVITNN